MSAPLRVIITGVTGMVGEGVLHECLLSADVEKILVVSRRPSGIHHPKLTEIIHADFFDLTPIEPAIAGYNACFFCLGVSSVGMKKPVYEKMTYDLTLNFAKTLTRFNRDMQFCYVSGAGTDSTEKGRLHWARGKGKTENDLQKLTFLNVWLFRPGALKATKGLKNTPAVYKWFSWMIPLVETFFPNSICSLTQLGQAMIQVVSGGYDRHIIEVSDIKKLSAQRLAQLVEAG
jgi:nucleoside-diphosphate-sugar epimerase